MIVAFLRTFISTVHLSSLCFYGFLRFRQVTPPLPLKFLFFFSFLAFLSKMTQQEATPALSSDSNSITSLSPVPYTSPIPPPPSISPYTIGLRLPF